MGEGWKKQEEQRRKRFFSLCVFPSFVGNVTKDDGRGGIWEKFFCGYANLEGWKGGYWRSSLKVTRKSPRCVVFALPAGNEISFSKMISRLSPLIDVLPL